MKAAEERYRLANSSIEGIDGYLRAKKLVNNANATKTDASKLQLALDQYKEAKNTFIGLVPPPSIPPPSGPTIQEVEKVANEAKTEMDAAENRYKTANSNIATLDSYLRAKKLVTDANTTKTDSSKLQLAKAQYEEARDTFKGLVPPPPIPQPEPEPKPSPVVQAPVVSPITDPLPSKLQDDLKKREADETKRKNEEAKREAEKVRNEAEMAKNEAEKRCKDGHFSPIASKPYNDAVKHLEHAKEAENKGNYVEAAKLYAEAMKRFREAKPLDLMRQSGSLFK